MDKEPSNSQQPNIPSGQTDTPVTQKEPTPFQGTTPEIDALPSNEEIELLSQSLANYASKHKLSVRNVRSIVKQLLTDERLIIFAQQLAGDITDESSKLPERKAGSKLTRSKRKDRIDSHKYGAGTALLDTSFSEQDTTSDEEYNPRLDRNKNSNSKDQAEPHDEFSNLSSPSSPALSSEPAFSDVESLLSFPKDLHAPTNSTELPIHSRNLPNVMNEDAITWKNREDIKRYSTRSRDNLRQKSLLELESALMAPDVITESPEEISNGGESEAWRNWLASFCLADSSERSGSDSEDADYNFLQDFDKEINLIDTREEFRYDFQVRVSQREILELVNSLVEEAGPWEGFPEGNEGCASENEDNRVEFRNESDNKLTWEVLESGVELNPEQKVSYQECMGRLQTQLQQHIQILFQTYLLSLNDPQLQEMNNYTNCLIQDFYNNISSLGQFSIPGLEDAMQLIYSPPQIEWKHKKSKLIPTSVINIMRDYSIYWRYPKLLPHQLLMPQKRSREHEQKGRKFVLAEDCMLAFGLSVFGLVDGLGLKIYKYVLPTKTPKQIISRIRNLCSSRYETNVVKHWKQTNELKIPWKELEESHPNTIPLWAQQCLNESQNIVYPMKKGTKKKAEQENELSPSFVNRMLLECDSIGKNLSQYHRLAIMNIIFDIDKYQTSAIDTNAFYRRLASGLWCFVTTALRKDEETYYELIKTIEDNADGNLNRLAEELTVVLKHHPALLFLFLKFLKTPTQQKEDRRNAFMKAKTFIDRVREKFKSNPEKAINVFTSINNLSKDKQPNSELEKVIKESLTNFEGTDQIFNECITENCEISSVSDGEFEEIYFVDNSKEEPNEDKYEFEEIYLDRDRNEFGDARLAPSSSNRTRELESFTKLTGNKRKIHKTNEGVKIGNKKTPVVKKPRVEPKSNKRKKNLKTDSNKK